MWGGFWAEEPCPCGVASCSSRTYSWRTCSTHATIQQLEAVGMDSRQAEVIVAAISLSDAELATKADLKDEVFRALWTREPVLSASS